MGRYATREDELDRMLRAGLFVDLYPVVRHGIRASVESYSIKKLEPLYDLRPRHLFAATLEQHEGTTVTLPATPGRRRRRLLAPRPSAIGIHMFVSVPPRVICSTGAARQRMQGHFTLPKAAIGIQNGCFLASSNTYATSECSGIFITVTLSLLRPGAQRCMASSKV
jgi:hypothetical protein